MKRTEDGVCASVPFVNYYRFPMARLSLFCCIRLIKLNSDQLSDKHQNEIFLICVERKYNIEIRTSVAGIQTSLVTSASPHQMGPQVV